MEDYNPPLLLRITHKMVEEYFIAVVGKIPKCPICENTFWELDENTPYTISPLARSDEVTMNTDLMVPQLFTVCSRCGYTANFAEYKIEAYFAEKKRQNHE